jgi:NADH-quinone oxidoreductase subunit A
LEKHVPNLVAALWAFGFFAVLLALSKLVRPDTKRRNSTSVWEKTSKTPWIRMSSRYQILLAVAALFFLGALVLYPAISAFRQWTDEGHGVSALIAVGLFLGTLSVALAFSWMKGDLSWITDSESRSDNREENKNGNSRERIS